MNTAIQERLRHFTRKLLARRGALVDWPPKTPRGLALLPPPLAVDCEIFRKKVTVRRMIYWNPLTKQLEPMCCSRCAAASFAVAFTNDTVLPLCPDCAA